MEVDLFGDKPAPSAAEDTSAYLRISDLIAELQAIKAKYGDSGRRCTRLLLQGRRLEWWEAGVGVGFEFLPDANPESKPIFKAKARMQWPPEFYMLED